MTPGTLYGTEDVKGDTTSKSSATDGLFLDFLAMAVVVVKRLLVLSKETLDTGAEFTVPDVADDDATEEDGLAQRVRVL